MKALRCASCLALALAFPASAWAVEIRTDPPGAYVWTSPYHDPAIEYHGESPVTIDRPAERIQIIVRLAGHLPVYTSLQPTQDELQVTLTREPEDPGERIVIGWRDLVPGLWVGKSGAPAEGWEVPCDRIEYRWGADFHWSPDGRYIACEHRVRTGFDDEKCRSYRMTYLLVFDTVEHSVRKVAWANLGHRTWRHEPTWTFDGEYLVYEKAWARGYHHGGVAAYRPADRTTRMVIGNGDTWYCYPHVGTDGNVYCVAANRDDEYLLTRVNWDTAAEEVVVPGRDCWHLMTTISGGLLWRDRRGMMLYDGAEGIDLVRPDNEEELVEYARTHPVPDWLRGEEPRPRIGLRPDLTTVEFNDGFGDWGVRWHRLEDHGPAIYPRTYIWSRVEGVREFERSSPSDAKAPISLRQVMWSRDGTWLLATGQRLGKHYECPIILLRADGSESMEVAGLPDSGTYHGHDWGPGNRLAFSVAHGRKNFTHHSLWLLDGPHGQPRMLLPHMFGGSCSWSPDGSQIAVVVGEDWGKTQVGLVDAATGQVTTITEVGDWASVAWHPSKPELAFTLQGCFPQGHAPAAYGVMTTDGRVLWEYHDRYGYSCDVRWSHDDRLHVGEDGVYLLDRAGNTEFVDRPFSGCYGSVGTLMAWTRDGRYAALLADQAIIIAEADSLTFDPDHPRRCSKLKPGCEPVRTIYPEGEWMRGHTCPTNAPVLGP